MTKDNESQEVKQEQKTQEEPQIYSVEKDLSGWRFSRREFLAAATAAAAAVTAAAVAATDESGKVGSEAAKVLGDSIPLAVAVPAMMAVGPGESFTQVWQFTNNSDAAWCRGARLHLVDGDPMQAPASVTVPDVAPGETIAVQVAMVAPVEPGTYQGSWHLQAVGNADPVASGPFVVTNGCIAESAHPYENNMSQAWQVINPDVSAQSTLVHFSRVEVETNYDSIILKDSEGQEHQRITGSYPSGLWSDPVPGRVVQVQLIADSTVTGWGFCLDQVETIYLVYLPLVVKQFAHPTPHGTLTSTPTKTPVLTKTPTSTPTSPSCLAESPHPYENNMDETWVVTNPDPSAEGSRVHFSRAEVEPYFDYIILKDSADQEYQRITGSYPSGLWSNAVLGRSVHVQLVTDSIVTHWGFCVDGVETTAPPSTPTPTHTFTPTRTHTPTPTSCPSYSTPTPTTCSCHSQCGCVGDTHYWYPC